MRLNVRWSLHFIAFGFFFKAIILTSVKSFDHHPPYVVDRCVIILIPSSPKSLGTSPGTSSSSVAFLSLISLIAFSTSLCKTKNLSCPHLLPLQFRLLDFLDDYVDRKNTIYIKVNFNVDSQFAKL